MNTTQALATFAAVWSPTTRLTMSRLSVSSRTWSHQLPSCWSSGLAGSQCLSFFSHKGPGFIGLDPLGLDVLDHLVVEALGVLAGVVGEAENGVASDAAQA